MRGAEFGDPPVNFFLIRQHRLVVGSRRLERPRGGRRASRRHTGDSPIQCAAIPLSPLPVIQRTTVEVSYAFALWNGSGVRGNLSDTEAVHTRNLTILLEKESTLFRRRNPFFFHLHLRIFTQKYLPAKSVPIDFGGASSPGYQNGIKVRNSDLCFFPARCGASRLPQSAHTPLHRGFHAVSRRAGPEATGSGCHVATQRKKRRRHTDFEKSNMSPNPPQRIDGTSIAPHFKHHFFSSH